MECVEDDCIVRTREGLIYMDGGVIVMLVPEMIRVRGEVCGCSLQS